MGGLCKKNLDSLQLNKVTGLKIWTMTERVLLDKNLKRFFLEAWIGQSTITSNVGDLTFRRRCTQTRQLHSEKNNSHKFEQFNLHVLTLSLYPSFVVLMPCRLNVMSSYLSSTLDFNMFFVRKFMLIVSRYHNGWNALYRCNNL